ncbi:hypothetical protein [Streptomyces sp. BK205]|uniref:hypothetical protein n=1 Tax=Streptomyces sp. BK205 TaxID=2512164 RepID=UPI0010D3CB17|nr:hypothetical protein [Streptomyces sp. BK205]TCR18270.1 hypothetical protein EV578_110247 [Streptomyces sp. BK205]
MEFFGLADPGWPHIGGKRRLHALETAQRTTTASRQPAVADENHTENRTQEPPDTDTTGPL